VPIEQIICAWLVMLWQRPTVEKSTKQIKFCVVKKMSHRSGLPAVCLNQYLQVKCSFYPTCIEWIYIITYKPHDVCVTVHGVAIIRTFTTSLHTPFTSVPELGAISQPLHVVQNNHTATLGVTTVTCGWVFRKHRHYSNVKTTCLVTKKKLKS